ncbi:hypothetical protein BJY04DRAFT_222175 [Aspergillus karnatakaensis]|uniref:nucleic acid/nucleotide deaminase domain-containing protein n=1 Tax=Aspergillus karnatakaensis TaxID=1810916 RepID=UPI003CCDA71E
MSSSPDPIITCAENIAISSLLHSIPVAPSRNNPEYLPTHQRLYILPIDTERKLAGTLAFLAHRKNEPNHIPAVCLEEEPDSETLKVILAVNKASKEDGNNSILCIMQGFESIFAILATVSTRSSRKTSVEPDILAKIVSMCSPRILDRMRLLSSGKKAAKRPFKDTLPDAVMAVRSITQQKLGQAGLVDAAGQFAMRTKEVEKLITSWSQYQVDTQLLKIVEGVYRLQQIEKLPSLIRMIPNRDMEPSSRESLLNIISKVSRYYESARFLYRTAKKYPLVRKMRAVSADLPAAAYSASLLTGYKPDLRSKIKDLGPQVSQQKLLTEISAGLNLSQQEAIKKYSRQVLHTLKEGKIHAEIQLISYCELRRPKRYPRIIYSSKDACFLCNMFLQEYRKIYTPRSHGRLYPGWKLPNLPQLADLERRFCQTIGNHVSEACARIFLKKQKKLHPFPNESTLFTLPLSITTLRDSTGSEIVVATEPKQVMGGNGSIVPIPSEGGVKIDNSDINTDKSADVGNETPSNDSTASQHDAALEELTYCTLVETLRHSGQLAPEGISPVFKAGSLHPLEIQIEHATGSRNIQYQIEWISGEEVNKVQEKGYMPLVVDAERLESIVHVHEQNMLYLTTKGAVVRISWISCGEGLSRGG